MASPKKLPTRLKIIRGTLKKSRVLENEMTGSILTKMLPVPDTLSGIGKLVWLNTGQNLIDAGIMVSEDLPLFEIYCHLAEYIEECQREIKNQKLVITAKNKHNEPYNSKNKYFSVYLECCRLLLSVGSEFGLSPSSRTHIPAGIKDNQKEKDLERLIFDT